MTPAAEQRARRPSLAALVASCLFFVPLVPALGLVLSIKELVRTPHQEPRVLSIAAIAVGATAFLLQVTVSVLVTFDYLRYVRTVQASEARMHVRRLADGVMAYQMIEGAKVPAASDWTPVGLACERPDRSFGLDPSAWQRAPWTDLEFSMNHPHRYQYRVRSSGSGDAAVVYVEARGDLDCDGVFSLFQLTLRGGLMAERMKIEAELE